MLESAKRKASADAERFELEKKLEIQMLKVQAQQIMEYISLLLPGEDKLQRITPLKEFYPHLFSDKKEDLQEQKRLQLELHKARMEDFMFWNNQKFKDKGR